MLSLYLKVGCFISLDFEFIISLCSDFHFFSISIICVAAWSLIIAPMKVISFYSWLFLRFSQCFHFSAVLFWCLVMAYLLLCDRSSFEVWAWRVHFQKCLWICIYCLFQLLTWTTVHLLSSIWLSDWNYTRNYRKMRGIRWYNFSQERIYICSLGSLFEYQKLGRFNSLQGLSTSSYCWSLSIEPQGPSLK